jgi:hypothetical protein
MGTLTYDSTTSVTFEDRALAHLQIVIGAKLVRGERFPFGWKTDQALGGGRSSLWLAPSIALHFKYSGSRGTSINSAWLEKLIRLSNSGGGLYLVEEPPPAK